jgi:hypothetical protein
VTSLKRHHSGEPQCGRCYIRHIPSPVPKPASRRSRPPTHFSARPRVLSYPLFHLENILGFGGCVLQHDDGVRYCGYGWSGTGPPVSLMPAGRYIQSTPSSRRPNGPMGLKNSTSSLAGAHFSADPAQTDIVDAIVGAPRERGVETRLSYWSRGLKPSERGPPVDKRIAAHLYADDVIGDEFRHRSEG